MDVKICVRCKIEKPVVEFNWKNKIKNTHSSECRECHKLYNKDWYDKNHSRLLNKAKIRNEKHRQECNTYIMSFLLNHPCVDCGNKDVRVLEFDHLSDKKDNISNLKTYGIEVVKKEIAKCEVRCANCHRIKTYERKGKCWRL